MHGLQAPPGPLFSAAGRTAGGTYDGAINTPQLVVDFAGLNKSGTQTPENLVERSIVIPLIEQVPHRGPWSEFLGQIAPRRPRSENPKNAIDDGPPIPLWPPGARCSRKDVRDTVPLFIRESMSSHNYALHGNFVWKH